MTSVFTVLLIPQEERLHCHGKLSSLREHWSSLFGSSFDLYPRLRSAMAVFLPNASQLLAGIIPCVGCKGMAVLLSSMNESFQADSDPCPVPLPVSHHRLYHHWLSLGIIVPTRSHHALGRVVNMGWANWKCLSCEQFVAKCKPHVFDSNLYEAFCLVCHACNTSHSLQ